MNRPTGQIPPVLEESSDWGRSAGGELSPMQNGYRQPLGDTNFCQSHKKRNTNKLCCKQRLLQHVGLFRGIEKKIWHHSQEKLRSVNKYRNHYRVCSLCRLCKSCKMQCKNNRVNNRDGRRDDLKSLRALQAPLSWVKIVLSAWMD